MRPPLLVLALIPVIALAQASFPTTFPPDAVPIAPETVKQRLSGKVFFIKPATGAEIRVQYQDTHAFTSAGGFSDSGRWRVEGSSVCVEWQKIPPSCSELRMLGDVLYTKRGSNGEVVAMQER